MAAELLVFEVAGRRFGLRSDRVVEVLRAVSLAPLPEEDSVVEGLLNLRGRIVPTIDLRRVFGMTARDIDHTDHLLVVEREDELLALRVDAALDLVAVGADAMQPAEAAGGGAVEAVCQTELGVVHVLNVDRLRGSRRLAAVAEGDIP